MAIISKVAHEKIHGRHSQHFEDMKSSYEFTVFFAARKLMIRLSTLAPVTYFYNQQSLFRGILIQ